MSVTLELISSLPVKYSPHPRPRRWIEVERASVREKRQAGRKIDREGAREREKESARKHARAN